MRLLIDTNLYVSHFLNLEGRATTISQVLSIALTSRVDLVIPFAQLAELEGISRKPRLRERIIEENWYLFLVALTSTATVLAQDTDPYPRVVRDPGDDYLIAAGIREHVDVLVSGDKDLLALRENLERPRIMSPAEFVAEFAPASS
jgi:uncharacterized protein